MKIEKCKSCGARIVWARDQNGTRLPLNYVRVRVYTTPDSEGRTHYDILDLTSHVACSLTEGPTDDS